MMPRERHAEVAGLRTRWLEAGAGDPAILLHGASLGSSADVWTPVMDLLAARGLRAIAPDLPGFGETGNPEDPSVEFRMRFVPAFMDALGIGCAQVVGHSQSGRIPAMLAFESPSRLARIVVVGTGSLLPPLPGAEKGGPGEGEEGGAVEPTLEAARALLEDNLHDHSLITPEALALRHRMSVGKNFEAFLARKAAKSGSKGAPGARPLWQRLPEVPVPLRMIYGSEDRGQAARRAARARDLYPALDLHVVEGAGHLVMWDAPSEFARLVGERAMAG